MHEAAIVGVVQAGHKEDAVAVPFDPSARWGRRPQRFAPGRRGVEVRARIEGIDFITHIVSRAGRHWLLLPAVIERAAGVEVGREISVSLEPPDAIAG